MVLYCLFTMKELHTVTGLFLSNLSVTDLGVGVISLPLTLTSSIEHFLMHQSWFLTLQGMAMVLLALASLLTLSVLRKNVNVEYRVQECINKRHARYSIGAKWAIATVFAITPALGFSKYNYNSGGYHCAPNELSVPGHIYIGLLLTLGILLPCIALLYCYCRLHIMAYLHIRKMRVGDPEARTHSRQCLYSVKIHMTHNLCWVPAFTFDILKFTKILLLNTFGTIVVLRVFANSVVNPILCTMRQQDFRRGFYTDYQQSSSPAAG